MSTLDKRAERFSNTRNVSCVEPTRRRGGAFLEELSQPSFFLAGGRGRGPDFFPASSLCCGLLKSLILPSPLFLFLQRLREVLWLLCCSFRRALQSVPSFVIPSSLSLHFSQTALSNQHCVLCLHACLFDVLFLQLPLCTQQGLSVNRTSVHLSSRGSLETPYLSEVAGR